MCVRVAGWYFRSMLPAITTQKAHLCTVVTSIVYFIFYRVLLAAKGTDLSRFIIVDSSRHLVQDCGCKCPYILQTSERSVLFIKTENRMTVTKMSAWLGSKDRLLQDGVERRGTGFCYRRSLARNLLGYVAGLTPLPTQVTLWFFGSSDIKKRVSDFSGK